MNTLDTTWRSMPTDTPKSVLAIIEAFCKSCPEASYTFAHIVLDDYNLSDAHIKWCLQQERVDEWFQEALKMWHISDDVAGKANWDRWQYDELIETRDRTIEFLEYLLTIPEEIRDRVWEFE